MSKDKSILWWLKKWKKSARLNKEATEHSASRFWRGKELAYSDCIRLLEKEDGK